MNPVTILIPVGPNPEYHKWLGEALVSAEAQKVKPGEILIVDDGANLSNYPGIIPYTIPNIPIRDFSLQTLKQDNDTIITYWKVPWNIGFSQAYNCGMGLAKHDNILFLASDDVMKDSCVCDCLNTWEKQKKRDGYYACSYQVGYDVCNIPNNAAMITRNLWKWLGGFPPAAFGGPDALILSILLAHAPDRIMKVEENKANYWIRVHGHQETAKQFGFYATSGIMEKIRDMETSRFVPAQGVTLL